MRVIGKLKTIDIDKIIRKRFIIFLTLILSGFTILTIKISNIMVFKSEEYKINLEEKTYSTVKGESSPRGRIYDRNGVLIVDNKSLKTITYKKDKNTKDKDMLKVAKNISNHISLDYQKITDRNKREYYCAKLPDECNKLVTEKDREKVKQRKMSSKELEELKLERIPIEKLEFSEEENKIAYIFYLMNRGYTYDEKIIKIDATEEEYAYISENNDILEGFETKIDWERVYPYGDVFKTILGTVSSPTQGIPAENKEEYLAKGYSLNDRVGLSYIEKQYEEYLHGEKAEYEILSSHEKRLIKEGSRGKDIVLTIDINLQRDIEQIVSYYVASTKGEPNTDYYDSSTVVIQNPQNGEILAMTSKKIVNGNIVDNTISILTSPIMPGSVVKGASMLVGYNTGAIHIGETLLDECVKIASVPEKCSSVNNLGVIDDITALAKSSNVYQFKIAMRVNGQEYHREMSMPFKQSSFDIYREMYHSFGLGVKTGIDLPIESKGYTSKDRAAGNLLDFVMGQYETYTPIQLSQYISTIANGGKRLRPHLLKEVHSSSATEELGEVELVMYPEVLNEIATENKYMCRVRDGFWAVMNSAGGYGVGYMNSNMNAAGKTGTSQSFIDTDGNGVIDTETITSSFIGYAPYYEPKMSIVVTSPNSSHPNSYINYMSQVTYYLTQAATEKYAEYYGR